MARPEKEGLDYYPIDVGILTERRMHAIIKNHGCEAVAVFIHVLNETYENKGYYLVLDYDFYDLAVDVLYMTIDKIRFYVDVFCERGFLQKIELGDKTIITSKGIQERFVQVREKLRRKSEFEKDPEIWLLDDDKNAKFVQNQKNDGLCTQKQRPKPADGTQKKRKEMKGNEIKSKEKKGDDASHSHSDENFYSFSSLEKELLETLKDREANISSSTPSWIRKTIRNYDRESIRDAIDITYQKKCNGDLSGSFIGYVDKILKNWSEGIGCPPHVAEKEAELEKKKREHMKPGALSEMYESKRF